MRILRKLAVAATALALATPIALAPAAQAAAPAAQAAQRASRLYISPWGSASVRVSDTTKAWLIANGVKLGAVAPFTLDADGYGFDMPIGSTAGDHLDEKGRIYYPGGMTLTQESSGSSMELVPTWIRLMPEPGYSARVRVNGTEVSEETLLAYTTPAEVLANGRPTLTGFTLDKVPFHVTTEAAALTGQYFGSALEADSMFGTLTPRFDYVPTS
ncbi:hypothetical protein OG401_36255 [Kitasatospora purpeofusca]|uniref:hypothetical protein n=1 Tax=Kitasatospora purpeofusca TaxID=67352 RepID=UPI00224FC77F|nr:hypothetical protein [Kitasatospora purpeofusca]MCX4689681.1 hypothetical protein [Kitasatospora purpeofusca]